ncbi:uncharacterized protein LOC126845292 [Adelges cooleyi]|uniref:uncharacterized protein LOC126845292 n=1 Tax=Adelges cooleyi TaxID=133065 RepID=UPI00217F5840|nr:uncharacterized protein LOC126845292 [Adelges cooleyi]
MQKSTICILVLIIMELSLVTQGRPFPSGKEWKNNLDDKLKDVNIGCASGIKKIGAVAGSVARGLIPDCKVGAYKRDCACGYHQCKCKQYYKKYSKQEQEAHSKEIRKHLSPEIEEKLFPHEKHTT